jgi:hypothetical protein
VPPDMSGAPEDSNSNSSPSGKSRGDSTIIHRTVRCSPDSVRCSKERRLRNSPASGNCDGCSAIIHRTVRCNSGATAISAPTATCSAFIARQRAQKSGVPILAHRTLYSTCPVRHRTSRRAQKSALQRSNPNGFGGVAGAPDMSGVHRTCPVCTGLSGAPYDRQPPPTVMFGGWAINTPNHPPFMASKFSTSQPLTRARH